MTEYAPGTVAVATVRGVPNYFEYRDLDVVRILSEGVPS